MRGNKTKPDITRTEVEIKRAFKSFKPKCWEIVKTTRVTNTTKEPFKEAPNKTNAHVFYKAVHLFPVALPCKITIRFPMQAIDHQSCSCSTRECKLVINHHYLSKQDNAKWPNESNEEQETDHPAK